MQSELLDYRFSDIPILDEGLLTAIFGTAGSGKSCVAAILAEGARLREGRKVYYLPESYGFHIGEPLRLADLMAGHEKLRGIVLIIDEFQRFLNKYLSASLSNQNIAGLLEQIRKLGIMLIITSNNENLIDLESLMPHVKLRLDTVKLTDDRCEELGAGFHLADCRDTAVVTVTDMLMRHGRSPKHWDGRKRFNWRIRHLIQYYKLYNTFSAVNAMEIREMDAESVRQAYEDSASEMDYSEFLRLLSVDLIPEIVANGTTELLVFSFSQWLANKGIIASQERIQRGLKEIGLLPVRGSGGNRFKLPSAEDMNGWLNGMISGQ